ncbi:serine/threonine-protein kinase [Plantactinospora sp. ZYX-F-223]|uniref:serine/threonine-protein kinase n=1 Tax=Plantactinospora sp. ZYX-F-223 TaxID=3144103 RepID=UPI0031FD8855
MAPSPAEPVDLFHDSRNTARPTRARFRYQDECIALRCIPNLLSQGVTAVVVEWSTDYIAVLPDGDPELVSIKHRDPGQGDWPISELRKVVRDLHMVWSAMGERCRCAFASNAAALQSATRELARNLDGCLNVDLDEAERFRRVLAMPDPPLPRRSEITAVGIRDMAGALSLLDRDPQYAEQCYAALVERIAAIGTEEPDSPEQRIRRLTGSLLSVSDRSRPCLDEQTLHITDLRELVERTHDERVRRPPRQLRAGLRPIVVPVTTKHEWRGGQEVQLGDACYLIHDPVEVTEPPDRSYREQRASARQLSPPERDVRITRLDILRGDRHTEVRRAQLMLETDLQRTVPGLPRVLATIEDRGQVTVVADRPGSSLPGVFGAPPYPGVALDALLRALSAVARTLGTLHTSGRAHRALHPVAFLITRDRMLLRDVGLAAVPAATGEGHRDYRAPEQERPIQQPPGPATDVYQLAAIVYHLATGQAPGFSPPPPPSLLRPELSPSLDDALLAGLASAPGDRPSLADLVTALTGVLRFGGAVTC